MLLLQKVWTVNLKSFEISIISSTSSQFLQWTVNLKSFEILKLLLSLFASFLWTVNLKSFEMAFPDLGFPD